MANPIDHYEPIFGQGNQRTPFSNCLERCWNYFVRKLLDNSDPAWRDPITAILPTAISPNTIMLLLQRTLASIEIRTYHTGSLTIAEELSTAVFRHDPNCLIIQIPEWLASSLDRRNGAQTTFNLSVFLLFSFYHGVFHRCLDVLSHAGYSAPGLGGYDARPSTRTVIELPSPEYLWMRCQPLVFGGLIGLDFGLPPPGNNRQWDDVCFTLARSTNHLTGTTVMPNFRYIQEFMREISNDVGNVVDRHRAMRTFCGSNVVQCPCCAA